LARRDLFYRGIAGIEGGLLSGTPPPGAFYAFLKIDPAWRPTGGEPSVSWALTEQLIKRGRIGCVPGVDFGAAGEGYIRFCFARDRRALTGALQSMKQLFGVTVERRSGIFLCVLRVLCVEYAPTYCRCRPPSMRSVSPVMKSP